MQCERSRNEDAYRKAYGSMMFGYWGYALALGWYAFFRTRSSPWVAWFEVAILFPQFFFALRGSRPTASARRRLVVAVNVVMAVMYFLMGVASLREEIPLRYLLAFTAVVSAFRYLCVSSFEALHKDSVKQKTDGGDPDLSVLMRTLAATQANFYAAVCVGATIYLWPGANFVAIACFLQAGCLARGLFFCCSLKDLPENENKKKKFKLREAISEALRSPAVVITFLMGVIGLTLLKTSALLPMHLEGLVGRSSTPLYYFLFGLAGRFVALLMVLGAIRLARTFFHLKMGVWTMWVFTLLDALFQATFPPLGIWSMMSVYAFMCGWSEIALAAFFGSVQDCEGEDKRSLFFSLWRALNSMTSVIGLVIASHGQQLGAGNVIAQCAWAAVAVLAVVPIILVVFNRKEATA